VTPPIIVISDDVDLYLSVKAAELDLEAWQVPKMQVFDAHGRRLKPVIAKRFLAEVVRLEEDQSGATDVQRLKEGLIRFLSRLAARGTRPESECVSDALKSARRPEVRTARGR